MRVLGSEKGKDGVPAPLANEARNATSGDIPDSGQYLAETTPVSKTPHPVAIEAAPASKDGADKKPTASALQSPSSHESFASPGLIRDAGTTVVASEATVPQPHPASPEMREPSKSQQLPDFAPAATNPATPPHITTEPGGDMQMRFGIRTAAFGAVEIYTSV